MKQWLIGFVVCIIIGSCSNNNVKIDSSLERYFKNNNVAGCFGLFNNGTGEFTLYNLPRYRDSLYLPASTFEMVNALIGLQTGKISNDSMIIKWDKVNRNQPEWDKDLTMYEAFRVSAVPYFQEVARRIGRDTLQYWLDSLSYGTIKIKEPIDSFWLNNTLKIRPDEQLGLVKRLYFNQLPFYHYNQEIVKRAMLFENSSQYKLSYKTGSGRRENGNPLEWVVGWVEENRHPYFFVLNIESSSPNAAISGISLKMVKAILHQLGLMQGKG